MLLSTLPTPTILTASTSVTLATPANRVGAVSQDREGYASDAPATVPSPGVHRDPQLQPGEREFTGPQEDPAMLATMTSAAGLKRAAGRSPSGFAGDCWLHTQPSTAR